MKKQKNRIFVIGTRGIPDIMGGVETHCEELFPRLAEREYDVTIIRRSSYVHDHLSRWNGVKLIDIDAPRSKSFEAIIHTWRAIWCAKKNHAQILHIHACGPALLTPIARLMGMKVVFTHHGQDYDREKWNWIAKAILRLGEFLGATFANRVIVISNGIWDMMARKYSITRKMHLIYNGVTPAEFISEPTYFRHLGIEPGKYVLGMCRFAPEKNLHHLIQAFSKIDSHGCKLVIAGDSDFEDSYSTQLKLLAKKNKVILTGFIKGKRLHSLLNHTRCYVLPSSHEGLPIALLEAMSYGAPTLVSDIPANLEVGLPKKNYFTCGDVLELTARLQEIVDMPYEKYKYDMEKYDWEKIAEQVDLVYKKL